MLANDDIEKSLCVLCYAVLSAESMKPSKFKRHLETKHPEHINSGDIKDEFLFYSALETTTKVDEHGIKVLRT